MTDKTVRLLHWLEFTFKGRLTVFAFVMALGTITLVVRFVVLA